MLGGETIAGLEVTGITCDSRKVLPGSVFAALPGSEVDGSRFIAEAVNNGAIAVIAERSPSDLSIPVITDPNPRRLYAELAARFYGKQPATIAAITGTNGKTSVAVFTSQLWALLGHKSANLGTLGVDLLGWTDETQPKIPQIPPLTTPDPTDLHKCLADLEQAGVSHLALEASSHGLDQFRLDGIHFTRAAYTNLSRDHLDYHGDLQSYLDAKSRLFLEVLDQDGVAVINADDPYADQISSICHARGVRVISCGVRGTDIKIVEVQAHASGLILSLEVMGKSYEIETALVGSFQVSNMVLALGLVIEDGIDVERVVPLLSKLQGARGRVELVASHPNGAAVYVDFAHTPDALETVLKALRPHARGKLRVVFGCGGDRDAGKRPEMGKAVCENADDVIVTDDNPRSEDPALIRQQAQVGCPGASNIGGRSAAIAEAIGRLEADDILVVAGKGHETGQKIGNIVHPFNDAGEILKIIKGLNA